MQLSLVLDGLSEYEKNQINRAAAEGVCVAGCATRSAQIKHAEPKPIYPVGPGFYSLFIIFVFLYSLCILYFFNEALIYFYEQFRIYLKRRAARPFHGV